jgi:hypothetical protein
MLFLIDGITLLAMFNLSKQFFKAVNERDYIGTVMLPLIVALLLAGMILLNIVFVHHFGMTAITS